MKINIDKESLLKSIIIAESIISSKNINTILANCLFNVSKDEIEIISTDNEIALRTKVDAVSDSPISFTANGKKFSSLLKELPDGEIIIDINDSLQIDIKTKSDKVKGHYALFGMSSEEYPEIPEFIEDNSMEIDQIVLKEMIKKVTYAASQDTIKPVFNGIFFISDSKGTISTVATDSRRLSIISRSIENAIDFGEGIIIPLKTVNEISRLLESGSTCYFSIKNNQCFFKIGKTEIISRVVEGQFPNYKQVIPKESVFTSEIDTKVFLDSIRRAMVFTREPANKVVLRFEKDKLILEANTPELGEAEEEIPIYTDNNETMIIGINAQFLLDSLKEIDSDRIVCSITGQMSPVTIRPENDVNYVSVIMPIQIKSTES